MARFDFASDNAAGAMPEVMEALSKWNDGCEEAYGADQASRRAGDLIREMLDADAEVWFVASGTAANALCFAALAQPHEAILAHRFSHAANAEAGAPAFFGGGLAIAPLDGEGGLIAPASLATALADLEETHRQAPAVLSLTQASEQGTLYAPTRLASLVGMAREAGLRVHVDGARLANAVAAGFDPTSLARAVAAAVIGGTKAGATPTEAIALFDKSLSRRFAGRLKHAGQLVSKSRFLSVPWIGMLESGAWVSRACHANAMAQRLAELTPFPIAHPVETNAVFMTMDEAAFERLAASGWVLYRFEDGSVRALCSWATSLEDVEALAADLMVAADPGAAADKGAAKRAWAGLRR